MSFASGTLTTQYKKKFLQLPTRAISGNSNSGITTNSYGFTNPLIEGYYYDNAGTENTITSIVSLHDVLNNFSLHESLFFKNGDGSSQYPYEISNAVELACMSYILNSNSYFGTTQSKNYKLINDIDLNPNII